MKPVERFERYLKSYWMDSEKAKFFRDEFDRIYALSGLPLDPLLKKMEIEMCWSQQYRPPRETEELQ